MKRWVPLLVLAGVLASAMPAGAAGEPAGFTIETVYEGAVPPTAVDFLSDGRLNVAGRAYSGEGTGK